MTDTTIASLADAPFIDIAFDPTLPFNELALLPATRAQETVDILKSCITARAHLAALNETCRHFSKPELLSSTLTLLEAHSNAALDGHSLPIQQVLRKQSSNNAQERALAEIELRDTSMNTGLRMTRENSAGTMTMLEVCSELAKKPVAVRRGEGPRNYGSSVDEVVYTPPEGAELLQKLMGNWEDFIQVKAGDLDPLVIAAVAYYQLMSIAPFENHNSSVARIFCQLLLNDEELLPIPVLNLSGYFRKHARVHDLALHDVTQQQAWGEFILFFLKGIDETAETALHQVRAITDLINETDHRIKRDLPRLHSPELVDVLFEKPFTKIQDLVGRGIAKRQTASQYLKRLCSVGVLTEHQQGKEKIFTNDRLLNIVSSASS